MPFCKVCMFLNILLPQQTFGKTLKVHKHVLKARRGRNFPATDLASTQPFSSMSRNTT